MAKILLVSTNTEKNPYPVPPVGLCLVAASIENKHTVKLYDAMFDNGDALVEHIKKFAPDFIGLSIRNIDDMNIHSPLTYIDFIKEKFVIPIRENSKVPIILGGSGFSIFPREILDYLQADYGVISEGEESFTLLIETLLNNKNLSKIPGVISYKARDFLPPSRTYSVVNMHHAMIDKRLNFDPYRARGAYSIQTKRGCYHKCVYCTYPVIEGKKFKRRAPEDIADEIAEAYKRLGSKITFEFVDSTFNDPKGHAEAICKAIIKKKLKGLRLRTMGMNPTNVTRELFDLMLEAGFAQIDSTPDTASPKMLRNMQKNFSLDELIKTATLIKEYNMPTMWFFIFGGPGESQDTIDESFDFIDEYVNKYDMVHMTLGLRIYPHTDLYNIALKEGIIKSTDSLLTPKFYLSKNFTIDSISKFIKSKARSRPNCIPSDESTPPDKMRKIAMRMRKEQNITEPVFRTLLKLRYRMFEGEKLW